MKKYDLVVFDLDGTLLDTSEGVLAAVRHTIKTLNFPMLSEEKISTFIGPPIQESFAVQYGLQGEILQKIATVFRNQYKDVDLLKAAPYNGIYELLKTLNADGIMSAVATYKREDYALTLLNHYEFGKYMKSMHGADNENRLKKQDIIQMCIAESGIGDYDRVVMVGDTVHDAIGAEKLGVDFIGVTYGFGFKKMEEELSVKNIGFVSHPLEILNLVEKDRA